MTGSRGDFSSWADIGQKIGHMDGTLGALQTQNSLDHAEIKQSLKDGKEMFDKIQADIKLHESELAEHKARLTLIEHKQAYIAGVAKFINDHPKIVIFVGLVMLAALLGWSGDQIISLLKQL